MWKDAWKDDHVNLYISSGSEAVILLTAKPNREYTYHDSLRMFLLYTVLREPLWPYVCNRVC